MSERLEYMPCKRCGKMVASLVKPIHLSAETQAHFKGICGNCMTEEERFDLLHIGAGEALETIRAAG